MTKNYPPLKTSFKERRPREFLKLSEIDATIEATKNSRQPIRNQAIAMLAFCQGLQPVELANLRQSDVYFAEKVLRVERNRQQSTRGELDVKPNLQALCQPELDLLHQIAPQAGAADTWLFLSERQKRISERSIHHLVQQAGQAAGLEFPCHPYMLRRSGLFYRAAILLQRADLSFRQSLLCWNWHAASMKFSTEVEREFRAIGKTKEFAFIVALEQIKAFTGIKLYDNVVDYLLGAYALFPKLQGIPEDYWLKPSHW